MTTGTWLEWRVEDLRGQTATDVMVLTANNRLTRTITAQLADTLSEKTEQTVEMPLIQPWTAWLSAMAFERSFEVDAESMLQVLDPSAARLLWIDVIGQAETDDPLVDVEQAALLAQQADSLLLQWHVSVTDAWRTPDYDRFLQWRDAYEARLHELAALDNDRLAEQVKTWIREGRLSLPSTAVLAGFNEYSPQMRELLVCLEGASVQLAELTGASTQSNVVKVALNSSAEQWERAAQWAQGQLKQHPEGRFAIVVPTLQAEASLARRVLSRTLKDQPFNVAVAPALSQWPLGRAMLNWLSVVVKFQTQGVVSPVLAGQTLIGAGCVGCDSEAGARALIDAGWRRWEVTQVSEKRWLSALADTPLLADAWQQVQAIWQESAEHTASWFFWANRFRQTLVAIGFPGDVSQNSAAYQATQALDTLLSRMAGLDDLLAAPTVTQALTMLNRLARQTPFQPQRDRHARLDVLGLLEAEGGQWDGVWVMGVTDEVLPAMASPNPLIPLVALSHADAPRSTPAREYEWACSLFKALCGLAPRIVFSWPARDGDKPIRPSPMIADVPLMTDPAGLAWPDTVDALLVKEVWQDEAQVPVMPLEKPKGGVDLLETQAVNPCWAFFKYRLGVDGLRAHALLPNTSANRGSLLHKVMEEIWRTLVTQEALLERQASGSMTQWLSELVYKHSAHYLADWPSALKKLEVERSITVVQSWLAFESTRPPFAVLECEQTHHLVMGSLGASDSAQSADSTDALQQVGPLLLKVSLDRLDQLPDGQRLLIDYKTGKHLPDPSKDWMGARLKNVQLLAYGQVLSEAGTPPNGLLWGQLHARQVGLKGLVQSEVDIENVDPLEAKSWTTQPWDLQMQQWRSRLAELGQSFIRGDTANVVWHMSDMKNCLIRALLRLHEEGADESA